MMLTLGHAVAVVGVIAVIGYIFFVSAERHQATLWESTTTYLKVLLFAATSFCVVGGIVWLLTAIEITSE